MIDKNMSNFLVQISSSWLKNVHTQLLTSTLGIYLCLLAHVVYGLQKSAAAVS